MQPLVLFQRILTALCRGAVGLTFAALILVVMLQVITRTFGLYSPVWTEEVSRYLLLYIVAFGVGLALVTGDLVSVDLLLEVMSERAAWAMRLLSFGLTAILGLVMIYPAWRFTTIGGFQLSPTLRVPMSVMHASVLVLAVLLSLYALLRMVAMIAGTDDGRPQPAEDME